MTQKEWVEAFQAINGRDPKPDEYALALKNGEFERENVGEPAPTVVEETVTAPTVAPTTTPAGTSQKLDLFKQPKVFIPVIAVLLAIVAFFGYQQYQLAQADITGNWAYTENTKSKTAKLVASGDSFELTMAYPSFSWSYDDDDEDNYTTKIVFTGTVDRKTKMLTVTKVSGSSYGSSLKKGEMIPYTKTNNLLTVGTSGQTMTFKK